jgi:hypothetical protein
VNPPARHHAAARFVAVAVLSLAVMTMARLEPVSAADAEGQPASAQPVALLSDDVVHGTQAVGTQPPRVPDVGRAGGSRSVRSVALAVAAPAAVLVCMGACRRSGRPADDRLPAPDPMAWAGPGGRRAPPHARTA